MAEPVIIKTPYPDATAVAKLLKVPTGRAKRIIKLIDRMAKKDG